MAERIPRVGDRLCDVLPGWVVRVEGGVVMVGPRLACQPQIQVSRVRSGCHRTLHEGTVVYDIRGRFGEYGEWQPYEPPKVLVEDLPLGTQVRFGRTGSAAWVVVQSLDGPYAQRLSMDAASVDGLEPVSAYRNDDTGWEWVEA